MRSRRMMLTLSPHSYDFVDACDQDHDGQLTFIEFQALAASVGRKFPLASKHFEKLEALFEQYDVNKDGKLGLNEIATLFLETQNKMTSLPATAQTASQQGHYIAKKLNKLARLRDKGQNINVSPPLLLSLSTQQLTSLFRTATRRRRRVRHRRRRVQAIQVPQPGLAGVPVQQRRL